MESTQKPRSSRDLFALIALAVGGLALLAAIASPYWKDVALGHTDYLSFYAGGRLAFTPSLYDPPHAMAEQLRAAHVMGVGTYYTRMPWFAAMMWPLARLPYLTGQFIWESLLLAGLVVFLALWPRPSLPVRVAIMCYSVPALMSLRMGQDPPLLLALMAISLVLLYRGKPVIAGLVLSLTLAKFHLFLPLFPAVLFARRWRFASGLFSGTAFLLGINFLVSGADWPRTYLKAITDPVVTPGVIITPSLFYAIPGSPHVRNLIVAMAGVVMMGLYLYIARKKVELLIAAAPVAILPLLPHAGSYDCLLLTPLALYALDKGTQPAKIAGALLLIPVTYFVAWSVPSCAVLIPLLDILLLGLCAMAVKVPEAVDVERYQIESTA
ncbi:MAG TPA: glycosyltransferase family 87 protein [Bryobacteraceae bacterium]|nr:glycosyltransferase family 87 protein [Bryobacteraceae bacterium]